MLGTVPSIRGHHTGLPPWLTAAIAIVVFWTCPAVQARAAEIDDARKLLITGSYEEALTRATKAIQDGVYGEAWHLVKVEAELILGKYSEAMDTVKAALEKYNWSVRIRWTGIQAARFSGHRELADQYADEIARLVRATPWRFTDAENLVVLGNYALAQGLDAKSVQDTFFQRAARNNPVHREPALALGRLALDKHDYQLAADLFTRALKNHSDDPDLSFGLGLALYGGDREASLAAIEKTLEINPHHLDALLWHVDRHFEGERYEDAIGILDEIEKINPLEPRALAFRAALAIVKAKFDDSDNLRRKALSTWSMNPEVDHIIGRELSQKYRFAEGAQYQKLALAMDEEYLPAKKQLAEDYLRLGREQEGWRLANEAYSADQYDVAMYNLLQLKDELEKFVTIEAPGLKVRMDTREAEIYGDSVLQLLTEAREQLGRKYRTTLKEPTLVEIFPRPNDFAVRTFGMPGADGFLGVCFGNVITANSPASQTASPSNWKSVLWHEFAHVITLNRTMNRMPRWLSEGISVYEERQKNPSWGEQMTPQYRQMILSDETFTPVSELSGAFLTPKSGLHLQFAYYESSLVVEFLIDGFGFDTLIDILDDLTLGISINDSLDRRTEPMPVLEEHFKQYARAKAEAYGAEVDWSEPDLEGILNSSLPAVAIPGWVETHSTNYRGLKEIADYLIRNEQWTQARDILEQAHELFPHEISGTAPMLLLAEVSRRLGESERERELLWEFAHKSSDSVPVYKRLIEIELSREDWSAVREASQLLLAVNPLTSDPHEALATAAETLDQPREAVESLRALLELTANDPAGLHYRLARQRMKLDEIPAAKREVLQALEEAPRYREALRLLLQLKKAEESQSGSDRPPAPPLPVPVNLPDMPPGVPQ